MTNQNLKMCDAFMYRNVLMVQIKIQKEALQFYTELIELLDDLSKNDVSRRLLLKGDFTFLFVILLFEF